MKLKLCISPCPNDTFAFYALVNRKIDLKGLKFEVQYHDIDQLNSIALNERADVCKVSAAVTSRLHGYNILNSGAAIGYGNAPLLVSKVGFDKPIEKSTVAIPGLDTTAYALLKRFHPKVGAIKVAIFSEIMGLVESGEVDAGVIIHEGRFVYKERGLALVSDFGTMWEEQLKMPIPLGCIVAKDSIGIDIIATIDAVIKASVEYAIANPNETMDFVALHAQELSPDVQQKHIDYFVNNFTVNMGEIGRKAIEFL